MQILAESTEKLITLFCERFGAEETFEEPKFALVCYEPLAWRVGVHVINKTDNGNDFELIIFGAEIPCPAFAVTGVTSGESSITKTLRDEGREFLTGWVVTVVFGWKVGNESDKGSD